jgi:hypothetical protein
MATASRGGKLYPLFTLPVDNARLAGWFFTGARRVQMASGIAIAMFVALFGWGSRYFGWEDPNGKVQLAIGVAFILGVLSGYKAKN